MIFYILILFLSVFISALSQVLLKKSALKTYSSFIKEYLNPCVIIAYSIYFVAISFDIIALRKVPVSFVPVAESSSYIFVLLFGKIFFKETFSKRKICAIILILCGIILFML